MGVRHLNKVLVALLCSVCILIVISSAQEANAVLVEPIINSPSSGTAHASPRHEVNVTVPDGLEGFRETAVFALINERTGQIEERTIARRGTFDVTVDTAFLVSNLGIIPQTDSYSVEVFSRDTISGEESAHNGITGLTIAPPEPKPIITSPSPGELLIPPRFTFTGDSDVNTGTESLFYAFTNPQTQVTFEVLTALNGPFQLELETSRVINELNLGPSEPFTLELFIRDKITGLESEHATVEGLTILPEGCPLPNGGTTTVFGVSNTAGFGFFAPQLAFAIGEQALINGENNGMSSGKLAKPVTLDGSESSSGEDPPIGPPNLCFLWESVMQPMFSMVSISSTTDQVTFTPTHVGPYVIRLTVIDNDGPDSGSTRSTTHTVDVGPMNQPPTAFFLVSPSAPKTGDTITADPLFGFFTTDPDNDDNALSFTWTVGGVPGDPNPTINPDNRNAGPITFLAGAVGTYDITLQVDDLETVNPGVDTFTMDVIVTAPPPNQPPTANAGPNQEVTLPQPPGTLPVHLDGSGSSDPEDGPLISYMWTPGPIPLGSSAALDDTTIAGPTFVADLPGTYEFELIVTDTDNADSNPDTVVITVNLPNQAPTVTIDTKKTKFSVNDALSFTGTGTDPEDGDISANLEWTLRDSQGIIITPGGKKIGKTISHPNPGVGLFTLEAIGEDSDGAFGNDQLIIEIVPATNKKSANVPVGTGVNVPQQVGVNGIESINFEFAQVDQGGTIDIVLGQAGPNPPQGFQLLGLDGTTTYIEITTNGVEFTGEVMITINYDDTGLSTTQEMAITLQHFNDSTELWEDTSNKQVDIDNNIVSGTVNEFSLFALLEPRVTVGGELIPIDTTSLLLAGTYSTAAWMIPVIVSVIGIGIVIARKF